MDGIEPLFSMQESRYPPQHSSLCAMAMNNIWLVLANDSSYPEKGKEIFNRVYGSSHFLNYMNNVAAAHQALTYWTFLAENQDELEFRVESINNRFNMTRRSRLISIG
jgi:hypothetical protein